MLPEPLRALALVTQTLESLDVPYFVGGSFASILYGPLRTTHDVDIIAELTTAHISPFIQALGKRFYVDEQTIRDAISHRSSFNLIDLETAFKVDIFIPAGRPADRQRQLRSLPQLLSDHPPYSARVLSAEDAILSKLEWYRLGNEISERQWNDIIGMLSTQGSRLDMEYLQTWARDLGLQTLLMRAVAASRENTSDETSLSGK